MECTQRRRREQREQRKHKHHQRTYTTGSTRKSTNKQRTQQRNRERRFKDWNQEEYHEAIERYAYETSEDLERHLEYCTKGFHLPKSAKPISSQNELAEIRSLTTNNDYSLLVDPVQDMQRQLLKSCLDWTSTQSEEQGERRASTTDPLMVSMAWLPDILQDTILSFVHFEKTSSTIVPGIYANAADFTLTIAPGTHSVDVRCWRRGYFHEDSGCSVLKNITQQIEWRNKHHNSRWVDDFHQMLLSGDYREVWRDSCNARCFGTLIEWFGKDDCDDCDHECGCFGFCSGHRAHYIGRAVQPPLGTYHGISEWALEVTQCPCTHQSCQEREGGNPSTYLYYLVQQF